jgi:ribosome-associated translation inhibitor RaiA
MVRLSARSRERQPGEPLQKAEVTVLTKRGAVRAECEEATLYAAIDRAADILARQLRKLKEREARGGVHTHHKSPATIADILPEQPIELSTTRSAELADLPQDIIRRKIFHVEALSVGDAVERMEAVDHSFYLFRSVETGEVQCVYRRNAGGYGVLIPKA